MGNMLSPGIYVNEMDFSDYVSETSTSVFGVIGGARRGPTVPTLVSSQTEFIKLFGEPSIEEFGAYSAIAVLGNADKVYYKRIVNDSEIAKGANVIPTAGSAIGAVVIADDTALAALTTTEAGETLVFTIDGVAFTYTVDSAVIAKVGFLSALNTLIGAAGEASFVENKLKVVSATTGTTSTVVVSGTAETAFMGVTVEVSGTGDVVFTTKYFDSTLNGAVITLGAKDAFGLFSYRLVNAKGVKIEEFPGLSVDPTNERYIETIINNISKYITVEVTEGAGDVTGKTYTISGGKDGISGLTKAEVLTALDEFSNSDVYDLDIILTPGWSDRDIVAAGITLAEGREDCLYMIDPPFGLTAQQVVDWTNAQGTYSLENPAFNSSYAAVYWPWVQVADTFSGKSVWLPPSGYVASQMAYTDRVSEPWYAPAGLNRGKLTKPVALECSPSKGERDLLYGEQNVVNPIINYKNQGLVIWGQKTTLRKFSALNRVNIRRLVNYLKKIIASSTAYFVFEPNDEYAWQRWCDMVEPKLEGVKSKRGIYDFQLVMNPSLTEVENSIMPGQIKFKASKTAEFVPLDFMLMPDGAVFEESV